MLRNTSALTRISPRTNFANGWIASGKATKGLRHEDSPVSRADLTLAGANLLQPQLPTLSLGISFVPM